MAENTFNDRSGKHCGQRAIQWLIKNNPLYKDVKTYLAQRKATERRGRAERYLRWLRANNRIFASLVISRIVLKLLAKAAKRVNQQDSRYQSLRKRAHEEGDAMAEYFQQSHEAYARGDRAGAKDLSKQGKEHRRMMEELNKEASDWIYAENNKDSKPGEVDLHGLYVEESLVYAERAIKEAKRRGDSEVQLIVGKGLHSQGGHAKIKPAIEEFMHKHQLVAEPDPRNAGVLIVQLGGHRDGAIGPEEIARRLDRNDDET